jgi:hypothetical protein
VPIIAVDARESTALNATVLPILMSETMHTKTAVATIAFAGTWKCGLTYFLVLAILDMQDARHTHCPEPF